MQKSLDQKLASIHADPHSARDFILADAKDADMGQGLAATGKDPHTGKPRSLAEYRQQMRQVIEQGLVDIMLMSASSSDQLTVQERLFDHSRVTPAVRANDTSDVYSMTGGSYLTTPSRPFRTVTIDQIQSGRVNPTDDERKRGANLGLYSITPNNDVNLDLRTLEAFKEFRVEAELKVFRYFLEVFDPNAPSHPIHHVGRFMNDFIVRALAGVPSRARPVFLKINYHGPKQLEELVAYDPHLVVGIYGGASGTTHDAFALLEQSKKHGARVALFGRKINHSEDQLTFVKYLDAIARDQISAIEAVRSYHGELEKLNIKPYRPLKDDVELKKELRC